MTGDDVIVAMALPAVTRVGRRVPKALLADPPEVVVLRMEEYRLLNVERTWSHWFEEDAGHMAHPYDAALETYLADQGVPFHVRKTQGTGWAARRHQLEALERWYASGWSRLDTRLRSSITEGVVVFLSLFDDNPAVHRAFCPPRSAYLGQVGPGEPRPLEPIDVLLDSGRVLALNFPVAMNPGLARIIGVMLKLDFQRAVLQRIPKMAAGRERVWRDLLFVCDEYHAFATVGETDPTGDERTFALSRQARLIPIVATQSISSLRSVLPGDESWRTLLQCFRNKVFLATSDEFTARNAAELCGRKDRLVDCTFCGVSLGSPRRASKLCRSNSLENSVPTRRRLHARRSRDCRAFSTTSTGRLQSSPSSTRPAADSSGRRTFECPSSHPWLAGVSLQHRLPGRE